MPSLNYKRTKFACYTAYFTMSSIFCLPPLLFVTFHELYHISWTLLGTLVLTNFCTQFAVDLVFTAFSKKFNIPKVLKIMPLMTSFGLIIYAVFPLLFPNLAYLGLLIGTVIFSVSAGLSEVLLSPTIAAIPSENPQRDMSFLHSLFAFGVLTVVIISTLFLKLFGNENWMYLTLLLAAFPVFAAVLFMTSPIPNMQAEQETKQNTNSKNRKLSIALCFGCIFFGSCAENAMSSWISSYMEAQLHIDKAIGDVLGTAMFAVLLGITRICYSKWGKNISKVLFLGMLGATCCYLVAGLSTAMLPAFFACILTGIFTSMLWPGTLILMEEKVPHAGVAAYALMAAGGDLGASVAPQLLGIVADNVGLQKGMLVSAAFPAAGMLLMGIIICVFKKKKAAVS